ncbi:hypothetical protein [Roseimaritima ulvae]|nr:hypothetical protein [Roseimaritima ulvae]
MMRTIPCLRPRLRRSAVVAAAVMLSGFAVSSLRSDRQIVRVTTSTGWQTYHVPVDSPNLASLRKTLAQRAVTRRVRKPDEYYRAAWRLQAATYYLQRSEQQFTADTSGGQPPPSVIQAAYKSPSGDSKAAAANLAHWRLQYANAEREFEAVAARLPAAQGDASPQAEANRQPVVLGPLVAAAPTAAETLALAMLGLAAGWGYYRAGQRRPAAILLHTDRKVIVQSEWVVESRSGLGRQLKRIDQLAWISAVIALLVWFC